MNSKSRKCPKL